MKYYSVGL